MFCMPECTACKAAGSCPKGELPAVRMPRVKQGKPFNSHTVGYRECAKGHLIWEYGAHWYRSKIFCEQCGKYKIPKAKNKGKNQSEVLPYDPPF